MLRSQIFTRISQFTQLAIAEFSKEITPDKNSLDDKENMDEPILS